MRLLHFADTHIGTETYGRIDPATGRHTRLTDFAGCLNRCVDHALEHGVDAALFAGDAYRACDPSPTHQDVFAGAIGRLVAAGIPVVMVCGNHDLPVAFGRAHALAIFSTLAGDRVKVAARPELIRLETAAGPLQVACVPWPTRSAMLRREDCLDRGEDQIRELLEAACRQAVGRLAGEVDPAAPAVLLAHLAVSEAVYSGSERTPLAGRDPSLAAAELADPRFDYVALGHLHRFQDLRGDRRPSVVYPGSIDRLDFGEAGDAKGCCLVEIGPGQTPAERAASYRHLPLPARPFVSFEGDLTAAADPSAALAALVGSQPTAGAIVRVRYRCTDDQAAALDLRPARAALDGAHLVAALIREPAETDRRPRVRVTEHHTLDEALSRYLATRPDLEPMREEITAVAFNLERRLTETEATGTSEG